MITMRKLFSPKLSSTLLIMLGTASGAFAQGETGTATLSGVQDGSVYDYTITLHNTSSVAIGTFWYAWIPGQFYLPSAPTSVTAPIEWTESTPNSMGNYSIEYVAIPGHALGGGASLDFYFSSTATPATLAGNSLYYPTSHTPIGTSYLYNATFSDAGYEFVVQSVPEPSVLGWLTAGLLGLLMAVRRQPRKLAVV